MRLRFRAPKDSTQKPKSPLQSPPPPPLPSFEYGLPTSDDDSISLTKVFPESKTKSVQASLQKKAQEPAATPKINAASIPSPHLFTTSSSDSDDDSDEDFKAIRQLTLDDESDDDRKPPATRSAKKPATTAPPPPDIFRYEPTAFANDPVRSGRLLVPKKDIEALNGPHFLTTALLDYIIQRAVPKDALPDNLIIGTCNSLSFFQMMNEKDIHSKSKGSAKTAAALRRKYQNYNDRSYQFLAVNCTGAHFFVVSVVFDPKLPNVFESVQVFDSLRRSARITATSISPHVRFLQQFQLFLAKYCYYNTKKGKLLLDAPDLILEKASFVSCPQQQNGHDCGLFGLATLLHIVRGRGKDLDMAFSQVDITNLRHGLYRRLSAGNGEQLNPPFVHSFLPALKTNFALVQSDALPGPPQDATDKEESDDDATVEVLGITPDGQDTICRKLFLDNPREFDSILDVENLIDEYEATSGNRLVVTISRPFGRRYECRSHVGCTFRVRFGRRRGGEKIVLKMDKTNLVHCGENAAQTSKNRSHKKRLKGRFDEVVDHVSEVKEAKPVPKDVMKAVAALKHVSVTYQQSFQVLKRVTNRKWEEDDIGFEMMQPYLDKFMESNPSSTTQCVTRDRHVERVFICPGMMKIALRHVRPVISLDAAHLKSKWKGTLYTASVKTASDDIYPVAVGIVNENENQAGWTWFLELLHSAVEVLVRDHPRPEVRFKYFTFISDRQKGLIEAMKKVFPQNHHCFCAIHIARNAENMCGKGAASVIHRLSRTFSSYVADNLLKTIQKSSGRAKKYLEEIPVEQWRSTSWIADSGLPPRYGIVTSNMSESTNNMFADAREGTWLYSIDFILGRMMERIAEMGKKVKDKDGVMEDTARKLKSKWDSCAGFKVVQVARTGGYSFCVSRPSKKPTESVSQSVSRYNLNVTEKKCTCGEWQEYCLPCVDAMAYFRFEERITFNDVLMRHVHELYTYANARELLNENIVPVCMDTVAPDGTTLPPRPSLKRATGRPKKVRMRKRSRYADNPEESTIVCSKCKKRGHNVRTCEMRSWLAKKAEKRGTNGTENNGTDDNNMNELDLS